MSHSRNFLVASARDTVSDSLSDVVAVEAEEAKAIPAAAAAVTEVAMAATTAAVIPKSFRCLYKIISSLFFSSVANRRTIAGIQTSVESSVNGQQLFELQLQCPNLCSHCRRDRGREEQENPRRHHPQAEHVSQGPR